MLAKNPTNRAVILKGRTRFVPYPRSPNGIWGPTQPPGYRRLIPRRKRGRGVKVAVHPFQNRDKKCMDVYLHSPMRRHGTHRNNSAFYINDTRFTTAFPFTRYHLIQILSSSYFRHFLYTIYRSLPSQERTCDYNNNKYTHNKRPACIMHLVGEAAS